MHTPVEFLFDQVSCPQLCRFGLTTTAYVYRHFQVNLGQPVPPCVLLQLFQMRTSWD